MSGILGVWNSRKPTPWQKMLGDLEVLGRDGQGDWHDAEVGLSLGRTQLFNTPESCEEQPVVEYEGCVLVWNGRVDDRESLLAGRTKITDAQLIIESYRRWGVDCLKHLIGEFVFILWDASNDLLFVGCDPVGGRTIAYYWDGETLLLSSRVLTLLHHPQVSHQLNHNYVAHTICGSLAHSPGITAFQAIKRLLPGSALIVEQGQMRSLRVAQLSQPDRYLSPKSPEALYEKFWYLLGLATKDRLRSYRPVYSTLSGGLDSTTVTIALLDRLESVKAFSYITDKYPYLDESEAINAFLAKYPQIDWQGINCDLAWALTEPWDDLPVVDDPLITCALPMNLKTMQLGQQQGFGTEFSGAWGDEFCYSLWGDQIRGKNWSYLREHLKVNQRWHSFFWNQFILPALPSRWQTRWRTYRFPPSPANLPEWLASDYLSSSEIDGLIKQDLRSPAINNRFQAMEKYLTETGCVGMTQLYNFLAAHCKIESVAPMGDRRMIEFANSIHPSLQVDTEYQKIFLRQANKKTLPDQVRLKPKNNCFDPLKYAGLGEGEQILAIVDQAKHNSYLQSIVNFEQLEQVIGKYRQQYREEYAPNQYFYDDLGNKLLASVCFFDWLLRVDRYYTFSF
jgi:asparagine synthase (glutamine-hydrolysing)